MRLILIIICCISFVNANAIMERANQSILMKFDLITDEMITIDDPRIKSIIYSSRNNSKVNISYFNPNAKMLANKIAGILSTYGVSVSKPELDTDSHNNRYVLVWRIYK
jgi:hypothetical protein